MIKLAYVAEQPGVETKEDMLSPDQSHLMVYKYHVPLAAYCNDPKFSDKQVLANSADPDQTANQGLHCFRFHLQLFDKIH